MKRFLFLCLIVATLVCPVKAEPIKWVDFQIPYESLKYAMEEDIQTFGGWMCWLWQPAAPAGDAVCRR